MKKDIYHVEVEVAPMEGTQLPANAVGAFVNVYVGADSIREAINEVERNLLSDLYKPVETSAVYQLDLEDFDYDTEEKGYPGNDDLLKLKETGEVWYGPFNWWQSDEQNS